MSDILFFSYKLLIKGLLCSEYMELLLDLSYTVSIVKLNIKGGSASENR